MLYVPAGRLVSAISSLPKLSESSQPSSVEHDGSYSARIESYPVPKLSTWKNCIAGRSAVYRTSGPWPNPNTQLGLKSFDRPIVLPAALPVVNGRTGSCSKVHAGALSSSSDAALQSVSSGQSTSLSPSSSTLLLHCGQFGPLGQSSASVVSFGPAQPGSSG